MITLCLILIKAEILSADSKKETKSMPSSLYDITAKDITGQETPLSKFKGKVALVVNTASKCGFTYQYKDLESLYEKYKDQGFVVLGFPSNDYMTQEPGSDQEIKKFCEFKYGVTFPLFTKDHVSGEAKQPVFKFLTESNQNFTGDPGWNFVKFLVDREGKVIDRFSSLTSPNNNKITSKIESLLDQK